MRPIFCLLVLVLVLSSIYSCAAAGAARAARAAPGAPAAGAAKAPAASAKAAPKRAAAGKPPKWNRTPLKEGFDPYAVLGLARTATTDEIRAAYKSALNVMGRRASRHGHGQETEEVDHELIVSVRQAYEVLSDPTWKKEWEASNAATSADPAETAWRADEL